MNGKLFIILLGVAVAQCCGATSVSKGYLASIGPYPVRFLLLSHQAFSPRVDYLPFPAQPTNDTKVSGLTNTASETQPIFINISPELYGPQLPQTNATTQIDPTTINPQQNNEISPDNSGTNAVANIPLNTNAVIPTQIFVNYFKQQAGFATNKTTIIVPAFMPPPPPSQPSSSATYIVK
ncbi:MAG: hypothetical protein ACP5T0_09830 [Verrucomicrobiia bacterium]